MTRILLLAALPEESDALFPGEGVRDDGAFAVRRLVAHGVKMMRGGYRLLLHYPIKVPGE